MGGRHATVPTSVPISAGGLMQPAADVRGSTGAAQDTTPSGGESVFHHLCVRSRVQFCNCDLASVFVSGEGDEAKASHSNSDQVEPRGNIIHIT